MTDQQIRDQIVGALSASMMPMEMEAECVAFLDRCVKQITWHPAKELPPMKTETYVDQVETFEYQISEPVLAYTDEGEMVSVRCSQDMGTTYWVDMDGTCYTVSHWREMPKAPEVDHGT